MRENLNPPLQLTGDLNDWITIYGRTNSLPSRVNIRLCADSNARRAETKQENSIDLGERFLE